MTGQKPDLQTMIDFVRYLGSLYPTEAEKIGWPWQTAATEGTDVSWQKIARSWRLAMDGKLDWVGDFAHGDSLLVLALLEHQASAEGEQMPNPVRLNNLADALVRGQRREDETADLQWQARQDQERMAQGPSETILRCKAVLMAKGLMPMNPDNPYAPIDDARRADLQRWVDNANATRRPDQDRMTLDPVQGPMAKLLPGTIKKE